jgi:type VI secretion system protein ImpC
MGSDRFRVELTATSEPEPRQVSPREEDQVRIVILGDFQGAGARAVHSAPADSIGSLTRLDPENLDRVIARIAPRLPLTLRDGTEVDLDFQDLEDFHPDRLLKRVPHLASLRSVRARAERSGDPTDALRQAAGLAPRELSPPRRTATEPKVVRPPAGSVLDWIVEGDGSAAAAESDLDRFVNEVVAPHLKAEPDVDRAALMADVDHAVSAGLRELLHDPRFQALEALWRGVALLAHRLESGPGLRIHLLQASRPALLSDQRGTTDASRSELSRALRALPQDGGPTLIVADLVFEATEEDLEILTALGSAALALGGIVIGGVAPGLVGVAESSEPEGPWDVQPSGLDEWVAFRKSPEAESVALALPRTLLRTPYGRTGETIRSFEFEELDVPPRAAELLWGNPAFVSVLLLAGTLAAGSPPGPGELLEASGLPVHSWSGRDGAELVPCTEWRTRTDVAGALLKAGFMPLVPGRNGDSARLIRFQTLESSV